MPLQIWYAVALLCASPPPDSMTGIVWHKTGNWKVRGAEVRPYTPVSDPQALSCSGPGELLLLFNGSYHHWRCEANIPIKAKTESFARSGGKVVEATSNAYLPVWAASALQSLSSKPLLLLPMSRSAGWHDSVVKLQSSGVVDLKEVFSAARIREIPFKLCPLNGSPCMERLSTNWDGTAAMTVLPVGVQPGTYRLIAHNGANESWVRFVESADFERVRREYLSAIETTRAWKWPQDLKDAPGFDRIERLLLMEAGNE